MEAGNKQVQGEMKKNNNILFFLLLSLRLSEISHNYSGDGCGQGTAGEDQFSRDEFRGCPQVEGGGDETSPQKMLENMPINRVEL